MRILSDLAKHRSLGIISICVLSVIIYGCGRKVFPKPEGAPPPPRVNNLSAKVVPRAVELSWSPVAAKVAGGIRYSILKSEISWEKRNCLECPPPSQQQVQSIDAASAKPGPDGKLRWVDSNVSYHRAYRYQIAVVNESGTSLSFSNPAIAKIYPAPAAPVNVTAATQRHGILIRWKPVLRDIEGNRLDASSLSFRVERLFGKKGWKKASPLVKGDAYYDQAIAPEQTYTYRVVPVRYIDQVYIYGEPSSTVLAKGPRSVPPPPPGRVWITPAHGALEIHWTKSDVKTIGYYVYRKEGKEIVRLTASPVLHPPFIDRGVSRGVTYFYAVSSVSALPGHKEGLLSKWVEVRNLLTR